MKRQRTSRKTEDSRADWERRRPGVSQGFERQLRVCQLRIYEAGQEGEQDTSGQVVSWVAVAQDSARESYEFDKRELRRLCLFDSGRSTSKHTSLLARTACSRDRDALLPASMRGHRSWGSRVESDSERRSQSVKWRWRHRDRPSASRVQCGASSEAPTSAHSQWILDHLAQ